MTRDQRRRFQVAAMALMAVMGAAVLTGYALKLGENRNRVAPASGTAAPTIVAANGVGGWRLDPPDDFRPVIPPGANSESLPSTYIAGVGPNGLNNDPEVAGPFPHEVIVTSRAWESDDHKRKLWLSVLTPRSKQGDVAGKFAAEEVERARARYAEVRSISNLTAGAATLFVSTGTNMSLQIESRHDQVLRLEVSGLTEQEVIRIAQSLRAA